MQTFIPDALTPSPSSHRVAIIDIGSNSLRLVVYDQLKRSPVALYNEKVMCQLGKGLAKTGRLNPEGVKSAMLVVRRFLTMVENMEVTSLSILATAAVRDAKDGAAFALALEKELGIEIDIISGEDEAKLGAYGVISSIYHPWGVTADLGGGSLELVHIDDNTFTQQETLPIGQLRLIDETGGNKAEMKKMVSRSIASCGWLAKHKGEPFYAIGGSFRAIARLHMNAHKYPLRILHQYHADGRELSKFCKELLSLPTEKLVKLPGMSSRRVSSVHPAALILQHLIDVQEPEVVIFSGSGIREGYLYEQLPPFVRQQDGLITACYDLVSRKRHSIHYANELMLWMQPLLDSMESESERRLRLAFCLLCNISHHIHADYRAEWGMQRILDSSFTSLTHQERITLGLAIYHRYQFKLKEDPRVLRLVSARDKAWARLVGSAANLAYHLTGNIEGTLHFTSLSVSGKNVTLMLSERAAALDGEAVQKRIAGVQEAFQKWKTTAGKKEK